MTGPSGAPRVARHFDRRTPEPHAARVWLETGALVLERDDHVRRRWSLDELVVVNPGGRDGPMQLELGREGANRETVVVEGGGFLAELRAANGGRPLPRQGDHPAAVRWILAFAAVGAGVIVALWLWGIPALAAAAAQGVPPEIEHRFGALVVEQMVKDTSRVSDPRVTAPVEAIFALLVSKQRAPGDSFEVIVARESMVNAFAAPGGYVVVTTGLLGAIESPDELAAVMAHEITHVVRHHTTRQIFARLGLRALLGSVFGDQGLSGVVGGAAGTLGELSNSRSDESEADAGAVQLLAASRIDPRAMERALADIEEHSGGAHGTRLTFLSTHPDTPARREHVRRLAAQLAVPTTAPLPTGEWRVMKAALGVALPDSSSIPR